SMVPPTGGTAVLTQTRPFDGTATSQYGLTVSTKCFKRNPGSCKIVFRLIAVESNGDSVTISRKIYETNDTVWRTYSFVPPAHGVAHVSLQVNVESASLFGVDAVTLTGPFGGS